MSLLNPPKPLTGTVPAFKAVNTMMNKPLNQDVIDRMIEAVTYRALDTLGQEYEVPKSTLSDIHMIVIDKEFKYGKGKEIVAFADGGKGATGKDLKYVKFFYWYDLSKGNIKGNDKTYSYSVEKARTFWNERIAAGYSRFDIIPEETEESPETE